MKWDIYTQVSQLKIFNIILIFDFWSHRVFFKENIFVLLHLFGGNWDSVSEGFPFSKIEMENLWK